MSEESRKVKRQVSCTRLTQVSKYIPPDNPVAATSVFLKSTGKPGN